MKRRWLMILAVAASLMHGSAISNPSVLPFVEGPTVDGKPFKSGSLKGKVVLVMFWSTGCAVCLDMMADLRINAEGWKDKPFSMVLVSADRSLKDVQDYQALISRLVPPDQRLEQLWSGAPGYRDSFDARARLPTTYVIDKSGKLVQKFVGRIPWEEWNKIAELVYS